LVYLFVPSEHSDEARQFIDAADELVAPSVWEGELANALWMAARHRQLSVPAAGIDLRSAMKLGIRSVASRRLWQGALLRAVESGLSIYDALFVELAEREQAPLATFDGAILKAYPQLAARPGRLTVPAAG